MLPVLVDKALRDAGFDLSAPAGAGWVVARVSSQTAQVAVRVGDGGIWLALPDSGVIERIGLVPAAAPALPGAMAEVGECRTADELYAALRAIKSLQIHPAAALSARVEARLANIAATERTAEVRQRIGQDVFREALFDLWNGCCAVTGLALPSALLRASHAKPWAVCTDLERLDPFNGLLLAVHLDALFDSGLMTFDDQGTALINASLSDEARRALGVSNGMRITRLLPGHLSYLRFHRDQVATAASGKAIEARPRP